MWLERAATAHPERVAVETATGSLTYEQLAQRAMRGTRALAEDGVEDGEAVALALPSGLDFAVALHACLLLRAPAQPVDLRLSPPERERRIGEHLVDRPLELEELPVAPTVDPQPDDIATVMHTSGTSGEPKRVELTYGNWEAGARGSARALGLDPEERWLCALPVSHVGGLSILIRSAIYGTTAILHERFDAEEVARALREDGITVVSLVPTMLARLLDEGLERPPHLRCALLGGAAPPPGLVERARAAGVPVTETYGLTEACSQVATAGHALDGLELRIGEDGEILVKGPTVAPGALAADGWLHTGDLGRLDEGGRLTVIGRRDDTIVTGGENVAPAEVEAVLLEHSGIADAAVHSRPDPEWGEAVIASVVLRPGAAAGEAELREHCAARVARFKVPKAIAFVDRLPRSASGKLLRRAL